MWPYKQYVTFYDPMSMRKWVKYFFSEAKIFFWTQTIHELIIGWSLGMFSFFSWSEIKIYLPLTDQSMVCCELCIVIFAYYILCQWHQLFRNDYSWEVHFQNYISIMAANWNYADLKILLKKKKTGSGSHHVHVHPFSHTWFVICKLALVMNIA